MSAEKLLKEYASGRRDFAGLNLANANLFNSDLIGVNLTKADLRRTNLVFAFLNAPPLTMPIYRVQNSVAQLLTKQS